MAAMVAATTVAMKQLYKHCDVPCKLHPLPYLYLILPKPLYLRTLGAACLLGVDLKAFLYSVLARSAVST